MSIFTNIKTDKTSVLALHEGLELENYARPVTDDDQPKNQLVSQQMVKLNLLDTLEFITTKITELENTESYLQARSEFLEVLKRCQKRLERHENTFIEMMKQEETDSLRFGRYKVTYQPSKKTVIDGDKLQKALEVSNQSEYFDSFLKKPEFKTLPECRQLLRKLKILSDVYGIQEGKKPILNITDTNTIKREVESIETEETEE